MSVTGRMILYSRIGFISFVPLQFSGTARSGHIRPLRQSLDECPVPGANRAVNQPVRQLSPVAVILNHENELISGTAIGRKELLGGYFDSRKLFSTHRASRYERPHKAAP